MNIRNVRLLHAIDFLEQLGEYDNALILREILDGEALPEGAWAFQAQVSAQNAEHPNFNYEWLWTDLVKLWPGGAGQRVGRSWHANEGILSQVWLQVRESFPTGYVVQMTERPIYAIPIDGENEKIVEDYIAEHASKQTGRKLK